MVEGLLRFVSRTATGTETSELKEAIQILRKSAVRWKDVGLWLRIYRAARLDINIGVMELANLPEDIAVLGFSHLRDL